MKASGEQVVDSRVQLQDGERLHARGITDEEIRRMGAVFRKITVGRYGPVRAVEPQVVLEVSFDSIQKSTRHKSGFALRFPRIVRLRPDKTAAEADTLETVAERYAKITGR